MMVYHDESVKLFKCNTINYTVVSYDINVICNIWYFIFESILIGVKRVCYQQTITLYNFKATLARGN